MFTGSPIIEPSGWGHSDCLTLVRLRVRVMVRVRDKVRRTK